MERPRVLDDQAVEASEYARKIGLARDGVKFAGSGLGLPESPLTTEEINLITQDVPQAQILACLARIYVDSLKSVANQAQTPWGVLRPLEKAAFVLNSIYENKKLKDALMGIQEDHRRRYHYFLPEMYRDRAKVLEAAAVLYPPENMVPLLKEARMTLSYGRLTVKDGQSVKALMEIEYQLLGAKLGEVPVVESLLDNFNQLVVLDQTANPHRVATVASWLIVWGEKISNPEVSQAGMGVFSGITELHPEWKFIVESEREKLQKQTLRQFLLNKLTPLAILSSPFTRYNLRRQNLYQALT